MFAEERSQVHDLHSHIVKLEKDEQVKPKVRRKKEIINQGN